jgi:hypothetical protein
MVHLMLNQAWRHFWADPAGYHRWEAKAVTELFSLCDGKVPADAEPAKASQQA